MGSSNLQTFKSANPGATLVILVLVLTMVIGGCSAGLTATSTPTTESYSGIRIFDPPVQISEFTLRDQNGTTAHVDRFKGKYTLAVFGYTHCPDICPVNLGNFTLIKKKLGDDAISVNFAFISVDGKRDIPEVLAQHLALFDPTFIGLMGDDGQIRALTQQFQAMYQISTPEPGKSDYSVTHTASAYLVDKSSRLIRNYAYGTAPDTVAEDIRRVIQGN